MTLENQKILPAISNYKDLKRFLQSDKLYCILLEFQLVELEDIVTDLKRHGKKVIVHIDLIKGIAANEFGAIYLIQKLRVEGIISIKHQAILMAKKRNIIAIQRIFLKDSLSLEKSLNVVNKVAPDYLEILPAISTAVLPTIIKRTQCKVFCGGLIQHKDQIDDCIQNGAVGVTTSNPDLWS